MTLLLLFYPLFVEGEVKARETRITTNQIYKDYFETWEEYSDPRQTYQNSSRTILVLEPPLYIKSKIEAVFGVDSERMLAIIKCESGYDHLVISKTSDIGLLQINLSAHWEAIPGRTRAEKILWLQDIDNNIAFAKSLFDRSGLKPWVCYTKNLI